MLRITVQDENDCRTLRLEGRLAGEWVREAEHFCDRSSDGRAPMTRVDLTQVTFVDAAGKAFLAAQHAQGAELIASGCLMRAVVAEITHAPRPTNC